MPHVDEQTGELVIRVVYDGTGEAGKTTTINALCSMISLQRRGEFVSPGTTGRQTEFFDWLDFSGGFVDGRRVRCQLVSVPGQPELHARRRFLLAMADAIVFVADSRPEQRTTCHASFALTREILGTSEAPDRIALVVQANKQDVEGALSLSALSELLQLDPSVPVVSSVAVAGVGLMDAFILAARLATDRVRGLLYGEGRPELPRGSDSPQKLHRRMLELELPAPPTRPSPEPTPAHQETLRTIIGRVAFPHRLNRLSEQVLQTLGAALEISAGHVWPPVRGRAALRVASEHAPVASERVAPWAPVGAFELQSGADWAFHSTDSWHVAKEIDVRLRLLALVRSQLCWQLLVPDSRVLFAVPDGEGWRIWMLTGARQTLGERLLGALSRQEWAALDEVFGAAEAIDQEVRERGAPAPGFDEVGFTLGRAVVLALPPEAGTSTQRALTDTLLELVHSCAAADAALAIWLFERATKSTRIWAARLHSAGETASSTTARASEP